MRLRSILTVIATAVTSLAVTASTAGATDVELHDSLLVDPMGSYPYNPYSYSSPYYATTAAEDAATGVLTLKMALTGSTSYFFELVLTPPTGQQFTAGTTYPLRATADASAAGISSSCAPVGSLTVVDLTRDAAPALTSLGVDYDLTCASSTNTSFYSFRWRSPAPNRGATRVSQNGQFSSVDPGQTSSTITYSMLGSGPGGTTVSGVSTAGANPLDFTITTDGCTGRVLARNDYCNIQVAFTPTAAYDRTAELVMTDGSQRGERRAPLTGYAYGPPRAMSVATATERSDGVQLRWAAGDTGGRPLEYVELLRGESADTLVHLAQMAPSAYSLADRLGSATAPTPDHTYVYGFRAHTDHGYGPLTTVSAHIPAAPSPVTATAVATIDPDYRSPMFSTALRVYDAAAGSTVTVATRSTGGGVDARGSTPGDLTRFWLLDDGYPYGSELTVGTYSQPFYLGTEAGRSGCSPSQSDLNVSDIAYGSGGEIARMAADYVYRCTAGGPAVVGSVRWHSAAPYEAVAVTTPAADFPVKVGTAQSLIVTYRNRGTTTVHIEGLSLAPSVTGGSTSEWSVTSDSCTGATLAPQAQCTSTVRVIAASAGHRAVLVRFDDDSTLGAHTRVLSAWGVLPAPAPVSLRAVSAGSKGTTISWAQSAPAHAAPTSWLVYRKVNSGAYALLKTVPATAPATSGKYTDPDLRSGLRSYFVRAVNIAGTGPASTTLTVRYGPQAPRSLVAVGLTRRVVVTWSPPISSITAAPLSGYAISRVSSTGTLTRLGTRSWLSTRSFPATGLTPGQRVTLKVQALYGSAVGPAASAGGTATSSNLLVVRSDGRLYGRAVGGGTAVSVDQPRTFSYEPLLRHSTPPAFSPDRRWIVCSVSNGAAGYPYQLVVRRTDGAGSPRILTTGAFDDVSPAVSRDGKWVVFLRYTWSNRSFRLYRVPFAGGTPTMLPNSANLDEPAWAPDGKSVIATNIATDAWGLYRLTLSGSRTRVGGSGRNHTPVISPDGRSVVFGTTSATTHVSALKLLTLSTGAVRTLSNTGGLLYSQSWTPDSSQVYFIVLSVTSDTTSLRRISRTGAGLTSLTSLGSTARLVLYEQW